MLLRPLGRGGMAEVWLAEQTSLKRNVALKLLKPDLMIEPAYVKRFQSEAKAAAGLSHPNIVQVFSIGETEGWHYIVQEYVQGSTLKSFLQKKGALDAQTTLHIMRQVASALQAASDRGIVHRDIKPENIMLTRKGEVKVADFGLAQLMGGERLNLTQVGTTMGTPLYMSPEQVNGEKLDQRSDIYSFGVTCYHMLAGDTPFRGESAIAVAMQHLQAPLPDLAERRPDVPKPLVEIVQRMLAKKPDDRYPNARVVLAELKKVMRAQMDAGEADSIELSVFDAAESSPSLSRPWLALSLFGLLVAGASAGMGWVQRPGVPQSVGTKNIPVQSTAQDQFQYALMKMDDEEAYKAVRDNFPDDRTWAALADSQLLLLYLKDVQNPARQKSIERQIETLARYGDTGSTQFGREATIAKAYVQVHHGQADMARQTLLNANLLGPTNPDLIQGTWERLLREVNQMLGPPGGGPRGDNGRARFDRDREPDRDGQPPQNRRSPE